MGTRCVMNETPRIHVAPRHTHNARCRYSGQGMDEAGLSSPSMTAHTIHANAHASRVGPSSSAKWSMTSARRVVQPQQPDPALTPGSIKTIGRQLRVAIREQRALAAEPTMTSAV